ncbi:MAG: hypothetical protein VX387_03175 [Planctomycetota bacterium]|nr:hypothetical protein [Planctomycetota bacterium]
MRRTTSLIKATKSSPVDTDEKPTGLAGRKLSDEKALSGTSPAPIAGPQGSSQEIRAKNQPALSSRKPGPQKVSRRTLLPIEAHRHQPPTSAAVDHGLKGSPWLDDARINMRGPTIVDSNGNTWLGDAGADPLDIRPNDANGTQHQAERVRDQPRGHHGLPL